MTHIAIREKLFIPEAVQKCVGREMPLKDWRGQLASWVQSFRAKNVGAHLITCSDESERENTNAFNEIIADTILPKLKQGLSSPFRTANLGSRYEWYSIRIAEDHFAGFSKDPKLMLISFCSHAGKYTLDDRPAFGQFFRYSTPSSACGAINAFLSGSHLPFTIDYDAALGMFGVDRKSMLLNPKVVRERHKSLYTAIATTGLQTMMLLIDIFDYAEQTQTMYLITNVVTINQPGEDTCIVCGLHLAEKSEGAMDVRYFGIGDDPSRYRIADKGGLVTITRADGFVDFAERIDPREVALSYLRPSVNLSAGGRSALRKLTSLVSQRQRPTAREVSQSLLTFLEADTVHALFYFYLAGLLDVHYYEEVVELVISAHDHLPANIVSVITSVKRRLFGEIDLLLYAKKLVEIINA
ncbi:MAG: hypothetical protein NUW37_19785 [Planctomycetes bacterium]|nr:hypothetical protein [Planctomycetota bacterium]